MFGEQELNASLGNDAQEDVVDPQAEEITDEGAEGEIDTEGSTTDGDNKTAEGSANPQSQAANHLFAQARKEAENEARAAKAQANAAQQEVELLKAALGEFGYTGTSQEIADALEAQRTQRTPEQVRAERMAEDERLSRTVNEHPAVKAAAQIVEQAARSKANAELSAELAMIQRLNPEIKTLNDLQKIENHQTFDTLVRGGMHIDKAYEVVHQMNRKAPVNRPNTKGHIRQMNGQSTGSASMVPRETMELYHALMPDATEKEIREHYAKNNEE